MTNYKTIFKSLRGDGKVFKIRHAVGELENKKHWVVEVYFDNREYPNIISGQYTTLKATRAAISDYIFSDKMLWGNI